VTFLVDGLDFRSLQEQSDDDAPFRPSRVLEISPARNCSFLKRRFSGVWQLLLVYLAHSEDYRLRSVYRAKNSVKVFCLAFLTFAVLFSLGVLKGISVDTNTWVDMSIGVVLVCVAALLVAQAFTVSVVLTDQSINYGSVFSKRSLKLNEVRYRREYEEYQDGPEGGTNVYYLELVPHDRESRSLKISKDDFDFDRTFWEWVYRIPDFERLDPAADTR
jgi:hypothetical protein